MAKLEKNKIWILKHDFSDSPIFRLYDYNFPIITKVIPIFQIMAIIPMTL